MTGTYEHSIDAKGRLFIPAKLREELGVSFYLAMGIDELSVSPTSVLPLRAAIRKSIAKMAEIDAALNSESVASMKKNGAVYFGAIGGAGALLAKCIKKAEVVAYEDLGAEAIRRLEVEDLPAVVIIDSRGNNLYEEGRAGYLAMDK